MSINIIGLLLVTGLAYWAHADGNSAALKAPFTGEYKNTFSFKQRTANYFFNLFVLISRYPFGDPSNYYQEMNQRFLKDEGDNVKYYAFNQVTGIEAKNTAEIKLPTAGEVPVLPSGYSYGWYFDGKKIWVIDKGQTVDTDRLDSGYHRLISSLIPLNSDPAVGANIRMVMAVKDTLGPNPYGRSWYYTEQQFLNRAGQMYIVLSILAIALLVIAIIQRRDKREFDQRITACTGRVWLEFKLLVTLLILAFLGGLMANHTGQFENIISLVLQISIAGCFLLVGFWWFYILGIDLKFNRKKVFTHNLINSAIAQYRQYEGRYPWQQAMMKRAYALLAAVSILALFSVLFLLVASHSGGGPFVISLLLAALGIYLIYRYLRRYQRTIGDLGRLLDHIELIKSGDMETRLELSPDADIFSAAQSLNSIQEGMSRAVAEKTRSERMKIELITNVSHDLKTPLTSIISYVDLLTREENLPDHVKEYVSVLVQKSERLKNLIQDLFDLSRASSNNLVLDLEQIDLARLIKQTLADMEEQVESSGLSFRLNIPDDPVIIRSDGSKLYRVFENLIGNTLKYSLDGSRVYIDLTVSDRHALVTIKNVANYEMKFNGDDIVQRFVRGDESRSTEGSGLGLSIAESFTQICGGKLSVSVDGDLFKVELKFPLE